MQRGGLRSLPAPTTSQRHGGVATGPDRGEPDFQVREKSVWQAARSLAVRRRARSALETSPGLDGLIEEEVALDVAEPLVERDCRLASVRQAEGRDRVLAPRPLLFAAGRGTGHRCQGQRVPGRGAPKRRSGRCRPKRSSASRRARISGSRTGRALTHCVFQQQTSDVVAVEQDAAVRGDFEVVDVPRRAALLDAPAHRLHDLERLRGIQRVGIT